MTYIAGSIDAVTPAVYVHVTLSDLFTEKPTHAPSFICGSADFPALQGAVGDGPSIVRAHASYFTGLIKYFRLPIAHNANGIFSSNAHDRAKAQKHGGQASLFSRLVENDSQMTRPDARPADPGLPCCGKRDHVETGLQSSPI